MQYFKLRTSSICGKQEHFLAKAGLEAALPADKQCLLIPNQVEVNTTPSLKLRTIYPAIPPGDQPIQQHHDAVADAKTLRKFVAKLELAWDCGLKNTEMRKALQISFCIKIRLTTL